MCFYQRESLPGYSAIFKHPNEELNFCYYLIPCGSGDGQCGGVKARCHPCCGRRHGRNCRRLAMFHSHGFISPCFVATMCAKPLVNALASFGGNESNQGRHVGPSVVAWIVCDGDCYPTQESDLARLHNDAIKNDPFISAALGPKAKIERMKAASLRLGSQGLATSFDDHLLIIGDAAGHIDPLTGEGIHTAIMVRPLGTCTVVSCSCLRAAWCVAPGSNSRTTAMSSMASPGICNHCRNVRPYATA